MVGGAVEPRYETPHPPSGFDPRKWVFDSRTGEFHKITSRHGAAGNLIDSRTYDQRSLAYVLKLREARREKIGTLVCWAVFLPALLWMINEQNVAGQIALFLVVAPTGLTAAGYSFKVMYNSAIGLPMAKAEIGPPPPPRPGRETVERQKVHGEGGVLGGSRLREAARGGSLANEGAVPLETYDD